MKNYLKRTNQRVVISNITPLVDCGRFPIKRTKDEWVFVTADILSDGHDVLWANVISKPKKSKTWTRTPMTSYVNDHWTAEFKIEKEADYIYSIEAGIDHFETLKATIRKRLEAGQSIQVDLQIAIQLLGQAKKRAKGSHGQTINSYIKNIQNELKTKTPTSTCLLDEELARIVRLYPDTASATRFYHDCEIVVDREKARFSAWYEFFPRSAMRRKNEHGTFKDCIKIIPEIAELGFDVVYLPPIHPIGEKNRKGKRNAVSAEPTDVGSPWAIGSKLGGHKSIHPELGTLSDFKKLIKTANKHNIDIAMDIAFQCAPDHPYVSEHPRWFKHRPDGSIQYAENPPKKYEDIVPINFETEDWEALWEELKSVFLYWCEQGVRVFRVDNPHTKPFSFWEHVISEVKTKYPETLFLAEAFTRPKIMYHLAKIGFTQSYTYFAWRHNKWETMEYLRELTTSPVKDYFQPNFWPNTPDILTDYMKNNNRAAFIYRLILAATLSSSYGIYGPCYELCVNNGLSYKEEYDESEKYELKQWNWDQPGNIKDIISKVNQIRKNNTAFQFTNNVQFHETEDDSLIAFSKTTHDNDNIVLVVVNFDENNLHRGMIHLPLESWGISGDQTYRLTDLLTGNTYTWQGHRNYVELNPLHLPAHIFKIEKS